MENQLETLEEKVLRLEKEIRERDEKIEEDRNAIRQIQFEANQNKQATLDAKETYVWRTGLKMEKLMQKTGIAFLRSLLVLSDFKKIGPWLALRKGFNELLNKDSFEKSKKLKMKLCRKKFRRFKDAREKMASLNLSEISAPFEKDLVSVILPVYNGENRIREAIDSILSQTYKNFELIIVNDGSTDGTKEIVESYTDKRIKIVNQENKKLPRALSEGFRQAKGEFYTWTSDDNILMENCLEVLVNELKAKPDTAMVYGNLRLINGKGKIKRGQFWYEKPILSGNVMLPEDAEALNTYANNTIGAAFMYRATAGQILGDYSAYKNTLEDYDYWMRMNSLFKVQHTEEKKPIYYYRFHKDSLTAHDKELGITRNRYKLMVLDDYRRDYYLSSLIWVAEADDENNEVYKAFKEKALDAGQYFYTREELDKISTAEVYSGINYIYFGENFDENVVRKMQEKYKTVLVCDGMNKEKEHLFDLCITTKEEKLEKLDNYRGWFYAKTGDAVFALCDTKIKNAVLYESEGMIESAPEYKKKLSVIICTYKRGEKLIDALWSVFRQSFNKKEYEIIVVDNDPFNSDIENQLKKFQERYSEFEGFIRYIAVPQKGLSYARNAGMWNATGKYLLFLDDDVLADYYLIEEIFTAFMYHPDLGVLGGQIILDVPFPRPNVVRKGWENLWSQFKISDSTFRYASQQFEIPYGANYAVSREAVWRVGGFAMSYGRVGNDFAGGEEIALALRLMQIGYGMGLQPAAKVLHRVDHDRFSKEHVRKTIKAGIVTSQRFYDDLYLPIGWTKKYVKKQIDITEKEIKRFVRHGEDRMEIFNKKCTLDAWREMLDNV